MVEKRDREGREAPTGGVDSAQSPFSPGEPIPWYDDPSRYWQHTPETCPGRDYGGLCLPCGKHCDHKQEVPRSLAPLVTSLAKLQGALQEIRALADPPPPIPPNFWGAARGILKQLASVASVIPGEVDLLWRSNLLSKIQGILESLDSCTYRDCKIGRDGKTWSWIHRDYDGAPDAGPIRHAYGSHLRSKQECVEAIDRWHDQQE